MENTNLSGMMDYENCTVVGAMVTTGGIEVVVEVSNTVIHVFYVDTTDDGGTILTDGELYHMEQWPSPEVDYDGDLSVMQLSKIIVGLPINVLTEQNMFEQTIDELLYRVTLHSF